MHRIIASKTKASLDFGPKANHLIQLDRLGLCPNFFIIEASLFSQSVINTKKKAKKQKSFNLSQPLRHEILQSLAALNIDNPIIRSSCSCEDSAKMSFAGMFSSIKSKRKDLFTNLRKVWLSQYSEQINAYMDHFEKQTDKKMNIIIQEYIYPDYSGVLFCDEKKDEVIVEFTKGPAHLVCLGKKIPEMVIYLHGFLLFDNFSFRDEDWIKKIPFVVECLIKINLKKFDAEFIVKNNSIFIVQIRRLTAPVAISKHFIISTIFYTRILFCDVSINRFNKIMFNYGIESKIKVLYEKDGCFWTDYQSYCKIIKELSKMSMKFNFLKKFYNNVLNYQLSMLVLKKLTPNQCLIRLKSYFINLYFIDYLINNLIFFLKFNIERKAKIPNEYFCPHQLSMSALNLLSILRYKHSLFDNNKIDFLEKMNKAEIEKMDKEICSTLAEYKKPKNPGFFWLQKLIWLHDANNFFAYTITKKYERQLKERFPDRSIDDMYNIP